MTICKATIADLPQLETTANGFLDALKRKYLDGFSMNSFVALWSTLIESGQGVIFLMKSGGEILGAIGGFAHTEQYCDYLVAQEFFWFVHENSRGKGVMLYRALEEWAKSKGCRHLRMVYMKDSMPDKVQRFYERMGMQPMEVIYTKELVCQ